MNVCGNDDVIQLVTLRSQSLLQFVEIIDAYFVHLLLQIPEFLSLATHLYVTCATNIASFTR